jgi:hypothetical protein
MHILFVVSRLQSEGLGNFTLRETLATFSSIADDVVLIQFVETVSSRLNTDNSKVNGNVLFFAGVKVLLHE